MKIYAVTPNPALDLSGHVDRIVANEKNYVSRTRLDPGGNAINAARIAKRLGASPILLGFVGGSTGDQLQALLRAEGLKDQFTKIRGTTRTNVTVTNDHDHKQTRLTFPGPAISPKAIRSLKSSIRKLTSPGILLLGGSIPESCTNHFYVDLIRSAAKQDLGIIVDVPASQLKAILNVALPKLLLIKPNQSELEALTKTKLRSDSTIARTALVLSRRAGVVCVSLADRGAIFAAKGRVWFGQAPRIKAKGTVGAGDSMVGAMASRLAHWGLSHPDHVEHASDEQLLDVFRWGLAAGAATAATEGTSLGNLTLMRRIYSKVTIQPQRF